MITKDDLNSSHLTVWSKGTLVYILNETLSWKTSSNILNIVISFRVTSSCNYKNGNENQVVQYCKSRNLKYHYHWKHFNKHPIVEIFTLFL